MYLSVCLHLNKHNLLRGSTEFRRYIFASTMVSIPGIPPFDTTDMSTAGQRFGLWSKRLDVYFTLSKIENSDQKVAALLHFGGEALYIYMNL